VNDGQRDLGKVRGVVIPAGEADLLLPNAAVAEVVAYQDATPFASAPPWLIGALTWHDRSVPLVSLAAADADARNLAPGHRARSVVCYTPNGNPALPYVGLLAMGPPRLAHFRVQDLTPTDQRPANPLVLFALTYGERSAWIPDMDAIEMAVLTALKP